MTSNQTKPRHIMALRKRDARWLLCPLILCLSDAYSQSEFNHADCLYKNLLSLKSVFQKAVLWLNKFTNHEG